MAPWTSLVITGLCLDLVTLTLMCAPSLTSDLPHHHKLSDDPGCCPGTALLTSLGYGGAGTLLVKS